MMNFGSKFRVLKAVAAAAVFVLCLVPRLVAAPAHTPAGPARIFSSFQPVLSDFDNDRRIDLATLRHNGSHKTIHIRFGRSSWTALSFDSTTMDRGALVSSDINHDGDADLVWISSDRFIAWLGDGQGNFSRGKTRDLDATLESLGWNFNRSSVEPGNDASPTGILTSTSWDVCDVPRCDLRILPQIFRFHSSTSVSSLVFVPLAQLRGPPSLLS